MKKFKSLLGTVLALAILCGFPGFGSVSADNTPSFTDVKPGDAHYEAIAAAVKAGIINGYADGRFGPNDPMTQNQLAEVVDCVLGRDYHAMYGADFYERDTPTTWLNGVVTRGEVCQALYNAGVVGLNPLGAAPYSVPVASGGKPEQPVNPVTPVEPAPVPTWCICCGGRWRDCG